MGPARCGIPSRPSIALPHPERALVFLAGTAWAERAVVFQAGPALPCHPERALAFLASPPWAERAVWYS